MHNIIHVEIPTITKYTGENALNSLPKGWGMLTLVRSSRSDGYPYDWRFFSLPYGEYALRRRDGEQDITEHTFTISEEPIVYGFLDCNAKYEYILPPGSREFVEKEKWIWVPNTIAHYDY